MLNFLHKPRVLLLDDDESIQKLVAALLRREGWKVDVVGRGSLAIEALAKKRYDALLLDLMMPHEGGMTVISHMRENDPAMLQRVILFTATPESVLRSIAKEVFAVVPKPFEPAQLVATLKRLG